MSTSGARNAALPMATHVRCSDTQLIVDLTDGRTISVPLDWYPRLYHGTPQERAHWALIGRGDGISWPELDEDISVEGLLDGRRSGETASSIERWLAGRSKRRQQ